MFAQSVVFGALLACFSIASAGTVRGSANPSQETTCQTHKRNSVGGLMQWDIQCDAQGRYLPLQCTKDKVKWCACYNAEEAITTPKKSTKSCECHLARDVIIKNAKCRVSDNTCVERATKSALKCASDGKFAKKQCDDKNQCLCVHPTTGQQTVARTSNVSCP